MTDRGRRSPRPSPLLVASRLLAITVCGALFWVATARPFDPPRRTESAGRSQPSIFAPVERPCGPAAPRLTADASHWRASSRARASTRVGRLRARPSTSRTAGLSASEVSRLFPGRHLARVVERTLGRTVSIAAAPSGVTPSEVSVLATTVAPRTLRVRVEMFDGAGRALDPALLRDPRAPSTSTLSFHGAEFGPFLEEVRHDAVSFEHTYVGFPASSGAVHLDTPPLVEGWRWSRPDRRKVEFTFDDDTLEQEAVFRLVATRGIGEAPIAILELPEGVHANDVRRASATVLSERGGGTWNVFTDLVDEIGGPHLYLEEGRSTLVCFVELRREVVPFGSVSFYAADVELEHDDLPLRLAACATVPVRLGAPQGLGGGDEHRARLELRAGTDAVWSYDGPQVRFASLDADDPACWSDELRLPPGWSVRIQSPAALEWTVPAEGGFVVGVPAG
ncbi:MAG: hypothetical protein R3F34_10500 [Planctomycetota bacterium]